MLYWDYSGKSVKYSLWTDRVIVKKFNAKRYRLIFDIDINILYQKLGYALGTNVTNKEMAQKVIKDERYTRFNKLIDDKFDKNTIVRLLDDFESRNDDEIRSIVTDNADIPTIFEYVLGI